MGFGTDNERSILGGRGLDKNEKKARPYKNHGLSDILMSKYDASKF